jgi:hypothetical protein
MRIYPDPELPDIKVTWLDGTCTQDIGDVALSVTGVDDPTEHHEMQVACTALAATFVNVSRQRFHIVGQLLDTAGGIYNATESDVDLRNGFDESVDLYFGEFDNFRIAWTFDMGATCASLGTDLVGIRFSQNGQVLFQQSAACRVGVTTGSAMPGVYTVGAEAFSLDGVTHAVAQQELPNVPIMPGSQLDLGTIVLTPCGASCP